MKSFYNNDKLEVVNDFSYLGTVFNYTGNFTRNQEYLIGKALKAMNALIINCKDLHLKPKLLCELFDSFVGSILGYASEVWGYTKSKEIERVHLKFCKKVLNVKLNTCNVAVYGELGRFPLYIARHVHMIKYWFKILKTDSIILKDIYNLNLEECEAGKKCWLINVKRLLCDFGFNFVWNNPNCAKSNEFIVAFKQRVVDNYIQSWQVDKNNSGVLNLYNCIKTSFGYDAKYIKKIYL